MITLCEGNVQYVVGEVCDRITAVIRQGLSAAKVARMEKVEEREITGEMIIE